MEAILCSQAFQLCAPAWVSPHLHNNVGWFWLTLGAAFFAISAMINFRSEDPPDKKRKEALESLLFLECGILGYMLGIYIFFAAATGLLLAFLFLTGWSIVRAFKS